MVMALACKQVDSLERYTHRSPTAPRAGLPNMTSEGTWRNAPLPHSVALSSGMYLGPAVVVSADYR